MNKLKFKKEHILTLFLFGILLIVSVPIHEGGHYLVCKLSGYEPTITAYNQIVCTGNIVFNRAFGGLFSAITLGIVFIIILRFFNQHKKIISAPFITIIIIQLINAAMELIYTDYNNVANNVVFLIVLTITIFAFALLWEKYVHLKKLKK